MDKFKLEYEMKRKGFNFGSMSKELEISRSAFYRKCNGKSDFTQAEIQKIMVLLDIDNPIGIFFTE